MGNFRHGEADMGAPSGVVWKLQGHVLTLNFLPQHWAVKEQKMFHAIWCFICNKTFIIAKLFPILSLSIIHNQGVCWKLKRKFPEFYRSLRENINVFQSGIFKWFQINFSVSHNAIFLGGRIPPKQKWKKKNIVSQNT